MANTTDADLSRQGLADLTDYLRPLIAKRRAQPAEDVLSDLAAAGHELSIEYISAMAAGLLFAGHETTVHRIDYGILLLSSHAEQRAALTARPELLDGAVEEILRMAVPGSSGGTARYARTDFELDGVPVHAGDCVLLSGPAANYDEQVFPEPGRFDISRHPNPHVAFGHGPRYCPGAALARMELRAVFSQLYVRLPQLRLTAPVTELRPRIHHVGGGVEDLPMTW
jgi:cytochrome P450